jgi:hypothetical protein
MQVALLLLLLVCLYLMSLFASGSRHAARALDYSRATVLVQRRLEEVRQIPLADLTASVREEGEPYTGFNTTVELTPFEGRLVQLQVTARAPSGALARASTLVSDPSAFQGVVADAFTHHVAWVNDLDLLAWNDVTGSVSNLGPVADGRRGGGLAGQPGRNILWRAGRSNAPVPFLETVPTPATWGTALNEPVPAPDSLKSTARLTGMVTDLGATTLVVGDVANRALWFHNGTSWSGPLRAKAPALGTPVGVAADPALSLIWVADYEFQCLRKLLSPQAAAAYPAADLESAGPLGMWHRTRFRPPSPMGFGAPVGLAMDPLGWGVFVHDCSRLYRFRDGNGGWQLLGDMPPALQAESPSGMACDRFGGWLYLCTGQGSLWKVRAGAGLVPGDFVKLWP